MKARFITVEGIEGAGKTSSLAFIAAWLHARGVQTTLTREPGGTEIGEQVRGLLLAHRRDGMAADTETLLLFAARSEHLVQVIRPALAAGKAVLSDRFTAASYAYQGGGRGVNSARIAQLETWVQGELRPDLTLILDVPEDTGLARAAQRGVPDRFECEQHAFFARVRAAYLKLAHDAPHCYRVIDASQPIAEVHIQIARVLDEVMT